MGRKYCITCDAVGCTSTETMSSDPDDKLPKGWSRVERDVPAQMGTSHEIALLCPLHELPELAAQ